MNKILRFEITDRCNLRCEMCWSTEWAHREMTYEQIEKIIMEYRINGGGVVVLTSREPLLYREIKKVLALCNGVGLDIKLLTNGTLINEEMAEYIVLESGISFISVSVHGNEEVHDTVTGVHGSLKRIITALENLNYYKQKYNKNKPELRITSVITNELLESMEFVFSIVKNNNIQLRLQHYMWHSEETKLEHKKILIEQYGVNDDLIDGFNSICNINPSLVIRKLDKYKKMCWRENIDFQIYPAMSEEEIVTWYSSNKIRVFEKAHCCHVKDSIRLRANGEVVLCQYIDITIGELVSGSIQGIVNNELFTQITNRLISGELFPLCYRCCHVESDLIEKVDLANGDI